VNRRDLAIGLLDGLKITALPDGRVRVEPQGLLAHPDMDVPAEEYPSLGALLAARLKRGEPMKRDLPARSRLVPAPRAPDAPASQGSELALDADARVVELPDALRAWAREDLRVRRHLAHHVVEGVPLAACLVALVDELAEDGVRDLRAHRTAQAYPPLRALLAARARRL
jgi:hypothetical protein